MTVDAHDWGLLEPLASAAGPSDDDAVLEALVEVERALTRSWARIGADAAVTEPVATAFDAASLDRAALAAGARRDGLPVLALVAGLREQVAPTSPGSAEWVHRGVTSQDVLDSALVLVARNSFAVSRERLLTAGERFATLARAERSTPALASTLARPAAPTTLGAIAAGWLEGVSSAIAVLDAAVFPVQLGGAVGTGEAIDVLAGRSGAAAELRTALATELDFADPGRAWHVDRTPVLAIAQAAATAVAAAARIGRELLALSRPELGIVVMAGGGRSSAMPHKENPVDAVLLTSTGLRAPGLLATAHAAALGRDARPAGDWHAEWGAYRGLLRLVLEAGGALAAIDLTLDPAAAARQLAAAPDVAGSADSRSTLDAAGHVVDAALERFAQISGGPA